MPFDWSQNVHRSAHRSDLTLSLVHLTKAKFDDSVPPVIELSALDVLFKILGDGRLIGSTTKSGMIGGKRPAVCFQDTPIYNLAQMFAYQKSNIDAEHGIRSGDGNTSPHYPYTLYGLHFSKRYVFGGGRNAANPEQGGRPVIYEEYKVARKIVPAPQDHWRLVNYDLSNPHEIVDWTHEREWRHEGDFEFTLDEVVVLLPGPNAYKNFMQHSGQTSKNIAQQIAGIVTVSPLFF